MKSFFSLFFTIPAKIIFSLLLLVFAILFAGCQADYFNLYAEDSESFTNVISQYDTFRYEESRYFKNRVENTVSDIIRLSMEYGDVFQGDSSAKELLNHYNSIGDRSFERIYKHLTGIKGLSFALVNHSRELVHSNVPSLNGRVSSARVQKHFGSERKNLLIVHSCANPYFATNTFIEYAEHIRDCAEKYEEDFDLYISFGTIEDFNAEAKKQESRHFAMLSKVKKISSTVPVYAALLLVTVLILLTVTGKSEPRGKTYPTMMNNVPNDLLVIMYSIVLICISSLHRSAFTMLITHGDELEMPGLWFTHSREFYTSRIEFCIVAFICFATILLCILKREYKLGMLFKNTYVYRYIETSKRLKAESEAEKTASEGSNRDAAAPEKPAKK